MQNDVLFSSSHLRTLARKVKRWLFGSVEAHFSLEFASRSVPARGPGRARCKCPSFAMIRRSKTHEETSEARRALAHDRPLPSSSAPFSSFLRRRRRNPMRAFSLQIGSIFSKQRRKHEGPPSQSKDPSPPPGDPPNGGLSNSSERHAHSTSSSLPPPSAHPAALFAHPKVPSNAASTLLYLQAEHAVFTRSLAECNIHELIRQPTGVDKNEWIANNIVAFYNHVNALYNAMYGFCTAQTCPVMTGPQNSSYLWVDEKNKKIKCSAPQYVDNTMMYIQRTLSDETIFPTRLDQNFPLYFDSLVRKMVRLLFHTIAHLYEGHFRQLVDLQLHPHLNSLFLHFILFLITSNIISADCSTVNTSSSSSSSSSNPPSSSLTTPGQTDARELRADLDSLDELYQVLGRQWQHAYGQACAQKRKAAAAAAAAAAHHE